MEELPLVSIITVNYGDVKETCELLTSLQDITYPNVEIIVVDNTERDNNFRLIKKKYPYITEVCSSTNTGYAGGINLGIENSKGDYLLLLNNDIEVEPGFIEPLLDALQNIQDAGLVSPKVLYYNSRKVQYAGTGKINSYTGRGFTEEYNKDDSEGISITAPSDYAFGAAMMTSRILVDRIGRMPEIYFMYYEELDWSEMFKRAGYRVYYVGTSTVYHKDSCSTADNPYQKDYYLFRNRILFQRRNTNFIQKTVSFIYISVFVYVCKSLLSLLTGNLSRFKALTNALFWNIGHYRIFD